MPELTLNDFIEVTRSRAGESSEGALDETIIDVLFEHLGYDSVALMEVVSEIKHAYGVDLSGGAVGALRTPRMVLDAVNAIMSRQGVEL